MSIVRSGQWAFAFMFLSQVLVGQDPTGAIEGQVTDKRRVPW